jgi:hypothetical protein
MFGNIRIQWSDHLGRIESGDRLYDWSDADVHPVAIALRSACFQEENEQRIRVALHRANKFPVLVHRFLESITCTSPCFRLKYFRSLQVCLSHRLRERIIMLQPHIHLSASDSGCLGRSRHVATLRVHRKEPFTRVFGCSCLSTGPGLGTEG